MQISKERDGAYQKRDAEKLRALEEESTTLQKKLLDSDVDNGVPNAPFKKTWPMLVMKRMIRYAAENGFEKIAWTPGDVQNERYNLSKLVDAASENLSIYVPIDGFRGAIKRHLR